MNMDCMSVERAVYYRLFLVQGLTERFDRELDERLERENPLSDLTLALSTCGGKREEQIHILNEYILNTAPEQINKDAVFSLTADELRERFEENPDTDLEAFAMLMHDIARDSDWWGEFEPWATMYQMPDFYEAAYKDHIISKACFRSIFRRLLYDKTGTDMVRFVIRRKIAFPGILLPLPEKTAADFAERKQQFTEGYQKALPDQSKWAYACQDCEECLSKCPQQIRIPNQMARIVETMRGK